MSELELSAKHGPSAIADLLQEYRGFPAIKAWVYYHAVPAAEALRGRVEQQLIRDLYNPRKLADNPELLDRIASELRSVEEQEKVGQT